MPEKIHVGRVLEQTLKENDKGQTPKENDDEGQTPKENDEGQAPAL